MPREGGGKRSPDSETRTFQLPEDVALPTVRERYDFIGDDRLRELYEADAFLRAQYRASLGRGGSPDEVYALHVFSERNERQRAEVWQAIRLRKARTAG